MNLKLLIDGIVRQTTVLIAQLSTAAGARSPLSHVADEVFFSLAREIEAQGVRKQVVADMFGLAMRSYQKKMQRLTESATQRDRSLWEAVFEFVAAHSPTRARILQRFAHDGERDVTAVLNDLLRSGLIFTTGGDQGAVFGVTTAEIRNAVQRGHDQESIENWIWFLVFRHEAQTAAELRELVRADVAVVDTALENLIASGRIRRKGETLESSNLVVPLGTEQGMETAILDHFRTVAVAIAAKVRRGAGASSEPNLTGGSTYTFTLTAGHPFEPRVHALLNDVRAQAQVLWEEVASYNNAHPPNPDTASRLSFYAGQVLEENLPLTSNPHEATHQEP